MESKLPMKKDELPPKVEELVAFASSCGFFVHRRVGELKSTVISIDETGDLIRFFIPQVETRPWGHQLTGYVGFALRTHEGSYGADVVHMVLNYRDFLNADRVIDCPSNLELLLGIIRRHLHDLPSTPSEVLAWAFDESTWLGKLIVWGRSPALRFIEEVRRVRA
jgi:hypothetical protein